MPTRILGALLLGSIFILVACDLGGGNTFSGDTGGWGTPEPIHVDNSINSTEPRIAMDRRGNAAVIWNQSDGFLGFRRYAAGVGWGATELLHDTSTYAWSRIAMDQTGSVIVVWGNSDFPLGTRSYIWSKRYQPGVGWSGVELVSTDNTGSPHSQELCMADNGEAIIVWQRDNRIWSNRYAPGAGWGIPCAISSDTETADGHQIAGAQNGNAIAVWHQTDNVATNIVANIYEPNVGWGTPMKISDTPWTAIDPQVAVDRGGNAMVVWNQSDGVIRARGYEVGTGWGPTNMISDNTKYSFPTLVAINANSNAIAIWRQYEGVHANIWANRYSAVTGWGAPENIDGGSPGEAYPSQIVLDSAGNAIALWYQGPHIWTNRYTESGGWGKAQLIDTQNGYYDRAVSPQVAVDIEGNGIAVWSQYSPYFESIWSRRYDIHSH